MRHIVKAAVMVDGEVWVGERHAQIMAEIWATNGPVKIRQDIQGFIDNEGQFWNRFQAGAIAFAAGQTATRKQSLLSEDLW